MGIATPAEDQYGEIPGSLQPPFVFKDNGRLVIIYGDWEHICSAESRDGKSFTRRLGPPGRSGLFTEGPGANTRDARVVRSSGLGHC